MPQLPMYSAKVNSPDTELSRTISSDDTIIPVVNSSALTDAPGLMVIRVDDNDLLPETIYFPTPAVNGEFHNVQRGFQGIRKAFPTGSKVCRILTAYDADTWSHNIEDLASTLSSHSHSLDGLTDTQITTPAQGEALVYDGANWVNTHIDGGTA